MLIAAVIGGGVSGALVTTWQLHRRLYRLEDQLIDQERVLTRETKRRAAGERWAGNKPEDQVAEFLRAQKPAEKYTNEW